MKISVPYNGPAVDDATVQKTFNEIFRREWDKSFGDSINTEWQPVTPLRWDATLRFVTDERDRATHSVG